MTESLVEVGFWRSDGVHPAELCSAAAARIAPDSDIITYITRGAFVESAELGFSFCRIPGCALQSRGNAAMGSATMTDGVWVWPEGLHHYVAAHGLALPPRFLLHMSEVCRTWRERAACLKGGEAHRSELSIAAAARCTAGNGLASPASAAELPMLNSFTLERSPEHATCTWQVAPLSKGWIDHLRRVSPVLVLPSSCEASADGPPCSIEAARLFLGISIEVAAAAARRTASAAGFDPSGAIAAAGHGPG